MYKKVRSKIVVSGMASALIICGIIAFIPIAKAGSNHITFHVSVSVADGYFSTDVTTSSDSVEPGKSVTITFDAQQGAGSLYVDLGTYGGQDISFKTPLSSISVPVSGISGVASLNVDLRGSLEGDLTIDGPGSLSTSHLSWNSWGEKTVTLDASNAEEGDTITVTLDLEYTGHIGAHGDTMLGDVTLISDQSLPGVGGSDPVVVTVKVQKGGILPGVPGFEIALVACAIALVLLWKRKK